MGSVLVLDVETTLDLPPRRVLAAAIEAEIDPVIVIGATDDRLYIAASTGDPGKLLILLERARREIMARIA